ncbi:MAG: HEAT repeat domain-containing protein [Acidobacteria bacterium]|nr:HEAT repeat domain-containing protein [Acidobacteriota bacterium]
MCVVTAACAPVPPPQVRPEPPVVTWEEKLAWMMRLEDQRILRDPNPPAPVVLAPATRTQPAVVAPPPPSDLIRLLGDGEARVRRRAALALGRVGLRDAVDPVVKLLADAETDVRQMAAFALGLIGDASARSALTGALADPDPLVQGRAAEALGMIGDRADAAAVGGMVRTHVAAGALTGIAPDDLSYPQAPAAEAVRLGLYALVRLESYEALAAAALDGSGRPISTWWPVAYALQRIGDARAAPALLALLQTPGRYTAAFAARGLGVTEAAAAAAPLRQIVEQLTAPAAVLVQAIRGLAAIGSADAAPVFTRIVADAEADPTLRVEAMVAFSAVATAESVDLLLDLLSDSSPAIRAAAMRALARVDPDGFLVTLSGLDPDRDWTVRAAQAAALGSLPAGRGFPGLKVLLRDRDPKVLPAVLAALVSSKAPDAEAILIQHLKTDDFAVRAAAAGGLAELKAAAAPALVEAYRAAAGDSTYVARAAMLTALNQIDPAAAQPIFQEALGDRDWAVRVRAAALLRERSPDGAMDAAIRPAPTGRPVTDEEWKWLIAPPFSPHAYVETDRGTVQIELAILDAPLTVANFVALARKGFFDGLAVHRVVPDFVVQDGDPRGDGDGGPGYTLRDDINMRPYLRGTVGMALDWEDTGGSQFFITHSPQPHIDGRYTVFGHVIDGMEVVDALRPGDVIRRVRIWDGINESR